MEKGYQEQQVLEYFQEHDKDRDGKLNYAEFTTFYDVPIFEQSWNLPFFWTLFTNGFTVQDISFEFALQCILLFSASCKRTQWVVFTKSMNSFLHTMTSANFRAIPLEQT